MVKVPPASVEPALLLTASSSSGSFWLLGVDSFWAPAAGFPPKSFEPPDADSGDLFSLAA